MPCTCCVCCHFTSTICCALHVSLCSTLQGGQPLPFTTHVSGHNVMVQLSDASTGGVTCQVDQGNRLTAAHVTIAQVLGWIPTLTEFKTRNPLNILTIISINFLHSRAQFEAGTGVIVL